jgi:hypothetical protein
MFWLWKYFYTNETQALQNVSLYIDSLDLAKANETKEQ